MLLNIDHFQKQWRKPEFNQSSGPLQSMSGKCETEEVTSRAKVKTTKTSQRKNLRTSMASVVHMCFLKGLTHILF